MNQSFQHKNHPLFGSASGTLYGIDVYEFFNNPGGEIIYIQAGIHGTEIIGAPIIYELMEYIAKNQSIINIVCVPISNPFATDSQIMGIQTGYNNIHTNSQNCLNYNRLGIEHSSEFENQLITKLFQISKIANTIIDIHSSGHEAIFYMYANKNLLSDAEKFGIENIISRKDAGNSFEDQNILLGKKSYTLELGASRIVELGQIDTGLKYILNYLFTKTKNNSKIWDNNQLKSLYSPYAGILVWHIKIGDYFTIGNIIASVYTKNGKEEIFADRSGLFLIKNPIHAIFQHQEIGQILYEV